MCEGHLSVHTVVRVSAHPPVILDSESRVQPGEGPEKQLLGKPHTSSIRLHGSQNVFAGHVIPLSPKCEGDDNNNDRNEYPQEPELYHNFT